MTDRPQDSSEPRLDAWMERQVKEAITPADASIPMERMWARVSQAPRLLDAGVQIVADAPAAPIADVVRPTARQRARWMTPSLIAAGVFLGVAIGRFTLPGTNGTIDSTNAGAPQVASSSQAPSSIDTAPTASTLPSEAAAQAPAPVAARTRANVTITPAVAEHLQQTVAVLASVHDAEHIADADSSTRRQLQSLLTTTRQLLDDPTLKRSRTHRLLEDLELVLAQLSRARATAPATREAADEALRETNLLPRLKAATQAGSGSEEL